MTYEIITLDHEQRKRIVWSRFCFTTDPKEAARIVSFLQYLKKNCTGIEDFYVYEVETDKAYQLTAVYDYLINKLSALV